MLSQYKTVVETEVVPVLPLTSSDLLGLTMMSGMTINQSLVMITANLASSRMKAMDLADLRLNSTAVLTDMEGFVRRMELISDSMDGILMNVAAIPSSPDTSDLDNNLADIRTILRNLTSFKDELNANTEPNTNLHESNMTQLQMYVTMTLGKTQQTQIKMIHVMMTLDTSDVTTAILDGMGVSLQESVLALSDILYMVEEHMRGIQMKHVTSNLNEFCNLLELNESLSSVDLNRQV